MTEQWIWPYPDGIIDLSLTQSKNKNEELASAAELWKVRREQLSEADRQRFSEKLDRTFAIESNVIERVFRLDRGITEVLVEEGIRASLIPHGSTDKPVPYVIDILQNALEAQKWMEDRFIRADHPITTFAIKELHQLLTQSQPSTEAISPSGQVMEIPLVHGDWKKTDNQVRKDKVILRYCPVEYTKDQMERLVALHDQHLAANVAPEVSAAWLHHRFAQIHPFQDGNGRVARCLAGLVFLKAGLFPVIVTRDETQVYIGALEAADAGDLNPLIDYFVRGQLKRFDMALNLVEQSAQQNTVKQAIASIKDTIVNRERAHIEKVYSVLSTGDDLLRKAEEIFEETAADLSRAGLAAFVVRSADATDHYFNAQVIRFARANNYFADTRTYRAWVQLKMQTKPSSHLILHFHSRGKDFLGVLVCAPIFEIVETGRKGEPASRESVEIAMEPFQVLYTENRAAAEVRFRGWLEETITLALAQAQRFL